MKVVVDTSIIVDYIRVGFGLYEELVILSKKKSVRLYIPTLVILELWKGRSMGAKDMVSKVERMLKVCKTLPLTEQIAKHSGELIRNGKFNDFIDASIAASAVYLDAQLATRNKKHFEKVEDLKLFEI